MPESEDNKQEKYTSARWDKLRASFQSSMLVDTRLSSLAESLDTEKWPMSGKDETPAKYIDLSFEELSESEEMLDRPERIRLLMDILEGTLAFDDPFGEMVQHEESQADDDNDVIKNLRRLQISPDFPLSLTNLSRESRQLCRNQELRTLKEFAEFSQNMAQHIVLAGDFRKLLNALAHIDEKTIANYLPYRPGNKGLHLPEAVGFAVGRIETEERLALYRRCGGRLEDDERALAERVSQQRIKELERELEAKIEEMFTWFAREKEDLKSMIHYGQSLDRFFMPINAPATELIASKTVAGLLRKETGPVPRTDAPTGKSPTADSGEEKGGFLQGITRFIRRMRDR